MLFRIILGIIMVVVGAAITIYGNKIYNALGPINWAEQHLGTEGGSRLMYKLIGIGISVFGFMLATGLLIPLVIGLIRLLFPGFVPAST